MKKVAILGTGPAGLMAAHAASLTGAMVHIFSMGGSNGPTKSRIGGAQFLHQPMPIINEPLSPDGTIKYLTAGTIEGYRQKVYGDADVPFVSMERLPVDGATDAWSLSATYDTLWDLYCGGNAINVVNISPEWLIELLENIGFDLVVSTIPKTSLCLAHAGLVPDTHTFVSQRIRIANVNSMMFEDNTMVYDGTKDVSWYRASKIFGVCTKEWGEGAPAVLPYEDVVVAKKPIRTDCVCFADKVLFTGRHGAWRKGVLTHDAFKDTWKALTS